LEPTGNKNKGLGFFFEDCRVFSDVYHCVAACCINVAMAGAIVMYDRIRSLGSFPDRMGTQARLAPRKFSPAGNQ
jgi:hypothetical protein